MPDDTCETPTSGQKVPLLSGTSLDQYPETSQPLSEPAAPDALPAASEPTNAEQLPEHAPLKVESNPEHEHLSIKRQTEDAYRRLDLLILPVLFLLRLLCCMDRCNLTFASVQMQSDLRFSNFVYGMGSGIFFAGCAAFQIPSTLVLAHQSAPQWLGFQCVMFGIASSSFALVTTASQFYVLRFLLGLAEAGCFPCTWYYLMQLYPDHRLGKAFAIVMAGGPVAHVLVGPVAAAVLNLDGVLDVRGWQWIFLSQGAPSIALGLLLPYFLPSGVLSCNFLSDAQKYLVTMELTASMHRSLKDLHHHAASSAADTLRRCLRMSHLWYISAVRFLGELAAASLLAWMPAMVQAVFQRTPVSFTPGPHAAHHHSHAAELGVYVVLLSALPFTVAAVVGVQVARMADRHQRYAVFTAFPYLASGLALLILPAASPRFPYVSFPLLILSCIAPLACNVPILTLFAARTPSPLRILAIPLLNTLASLGGFVGPVLVGALLDHFRTFNAALLLLAALMLLCGVLAWGLQVYEGGRGGKDGQDCAESGGSPPLPVACH